MKTVEIHVFRRDDLKKVLTLNWTEGNPTPLQLMGLAAEVCDCVQISSTEWKLVELDNGAIVSYMGDGSPKCDLIIIDIFDDEEEEEEGGEKNANSH